MRIFVLSQLKDLKVKGTIDLKSKCYALSHSKLYPKRESQTKKIRQIITQIIRTRNSTITTLHFNIVQYTNIM